MAGRLRPPEAGGDDNGLGNSNVHAHVIKKKCFKLCIYATQNVPSAFLQTEQL